MVLKFLKERVFNQASIPGALLVTGGVLVFADGLNLTGLLAMGFIAVGAYLMYVKN